LELDATSVFTLRIVLLLYCEQDNKRQDNKRKSHIAMNNYPFGSIDPRFSSPTATARSWDEAYEIIEQAPTYWLTTVRPDGRPHVTPLIAVWLEQILYFCTGPDERKAKNLARNPHVVMTTGCNRMEGLDIVIEGDAILVSDDATLQRVADAYPAKYEGWHFDVRDGALYGDGGRALLFQVVPVVIFGFGKSEPFSQTRWHY